MDMRRERKWWEMVGSGGQEKDGRDTTTAGEGWVAISAVSSFRGTSLIESE